MRRRPNTFFCFSPPVMVATFVFETISALYVLWRYKLQTMTRLVALTLICLAAFQVAEFMVCRGAPRHALEAARAGFVAITLLPALGLHMSFIIAGVRRRWPVLLAYITAAAFVAFFALVGHSLQHDACLGNYVIFNLAPHAGMLFGIYYYLWLAVGILSSWNLARTRPKARRALYGLMLGYTTFILPTATVNFLSHATLADIPSVMCGFAVLLAAALVGIVIPNTAKRRS